nr:MAG TPA: hypothetical protein [Caudoviricetes sp.]
MNKYFKIILILLKLILKCLLIIYAYVWRNKNVKNVNLLLIIVWQLLAKEKRLMRALFPSLKMVKMVYII